MDNVYSDYIHTRKLNLNLSKIKNSSHKMYGIVKNNFVNGEKDHTGQSSMMESVYSKYNLFMYPFPEFYELFQEIRKMFREKVDQETLDESYYLQSWINFYNKGDFISWHGHWPSESRAWHGYYCVDVEPSKTTYKVPGEATKIDVHNENNLLILSKSDGDLHRTWPWEYDHPRITIAFDVIPSCNILRGVDDKINRTGLNHWIPV